MLFQRASQGYPSIHQIVQGEPHLRTITVQSGELLINIFYCLFWCIYLCCLSSEKHGEKYREPIREATLRTVRVSFWWLQRGIQGWNKIISSYPYSSHRRGVRILWYDIISSSLTSPLYSERSRRLEQQIMSYNSKQVNSSGVWTISNVFIVRSSSFFQQEEKWVCYQPWTGATRDPAFPEGI